MKAAFYDECLQCCQNSLCLGLLPQTLHLWKVFQISGHTIARNLCCQVLLQQRGCGGRVDIPRTVLRCLRIQHGVLVLTNPPPFLTSLVSPDEHTYGLLNNWDGQSSFASGFSCVQVGYAAATQL